MEDQCQPGLHFRWTLSSTKPCHCAAPLRTQKDGTVGERAADSLRNACFNSRHSLRVPRGLFLLRGGVDHLCERVTGGGGAGIGI